MGFLKFLKREKREDLDELDLPPAPPPLEGFGDNPDFPEFPDLPEKISAPKEEPGLGFGSKSDEKFPEFQDIPELPEIPDIGEQVQQPAGVPAYPMPALSAQPIPEPPARMPLEATQQGEQPGQLDYPRDAERLFGQQRRVMHERPAAKTIYVRVDKFKAALGNINMARSDLRRSEEALSKLENIKNSKDRSFDKFRASLDDLQKKFIFIDKTLFKG